MEQETLDNFNEEPEESNYPANRYRPLYVIFPFILLASIFKVMHWPGQVFLLLISLSLITAHAIAMLLFLRQNELFTNIGAASLVCGMTYYVMNEYNQNGWMAVGGIVVVAVIGFYFWIRGK
jgi:hypothetical protein